MTKCPCERPAGQKKPTTNDIKTMPIPDAPALAAEFEVGDEAGTEAEIEAEMAPEEPGDELAEDVVEAAGAFPAFSLNAAAVCVLEGLMASTVPLLHNPPASSKNL